MTQTERKHTRIEWGIQHPSGAVRWPNEAACRAHANKYGGTVVSRQVTTITTGWQPATASGGGT